jgi:hypothetical protein
MAFPDQRERELVVSHDTGVLFGVVVNKDDKEGVSLGVVVSKILLSRCKQ